LRTIKLVHDLAPLVMSSKLPPPDPFETLGWTPSDSVQMDASAAVYVGGPPSPEGKRISRVILDLRPGVLIVVAPSSTGGDPPSAPPGDRTG
jgi:hypothetical protein